MQSRLLQEAFPDCPTRQVSAYPQKDVHTLLHTHSLKDPAASFRALGSTGQCFSDTPWNPGDMGSNSMDSAV